MTDSADTPSPGAGAPGTDLGRIDHMRLVRLIGRGPSAAVYLVQDTMAGRLLAAKVLPGELSGDSLEAARLRKALVPAAHFSHAHVTPLRHLHSVWEVDAGARALGVREGSLVLVSDFAGGVDLRQWLASCAGRADFRNAICRVFREAAAVLDFAHAQGLVHGAVSPGNLLIRPTDGACLLSDLAASYEVRRSLRLMDASAAPLLASWVAPEVVPGEGARAPADVYAFAAVLAGALVGDLSGAGRAPASLDRLPPACRAALAAALAADPERRPLRCSQIVEAMAAAGGESVSGAAGSGAGPSERPRSGAGTDLPPAIAPIPLDGGPSCRDRTPAAGPPPPAAAPAPVVLAPAATPAAPPAVSLRPAPHASAPVAGGVPRTPAVGAPRGRPRMGLGVNLALAAAVLLLAGLAGAWFWHSRAVRQNCVLAEPVWTTVAEQTRLAPRFAYSLVLGAGVEDPRLRFRLLGQTRRLDLVMDGPAVSVRESTGGGRSTVLAKASLAAPCRPGDNLAVAATPCSVEMFLNGERVVAAPWPMEAMHQALWQVPPGASAPGEFRLQKIATLLFADDFMHGEEELGEWKPQAGTWTVHALQNPIRSANPFSFLGQGEDALATAGQWFWRNYRFAVAAHPLSGASFGIKACWSAPNHAYELLWRNAGEGAGTLSLTRACGVVRTELAKASQSFVPAQWYRLEISQVEGVIEVSVDGSPVLSAVDPNPLLGGAVGLWSRGGEGTVFDDVTVGPVEQISFDFGRQSSRGVSLLRPAVAAPGQAVGAGFDVGGVILENARITALLQGLQGVRPDEPIELLARRRGGEELGLRLVREGDGWGARIFVRQVGRETTLAAERMAPPGADSRVSLHVLGADAWGVVDGTLVAFATDVPVRGQGTVGLRLPGSAAVTRRSLEVAPERPLAELENRVETFTHEASMQTWSSPSWNGISSTAVRGPPTGTVQTSGKTCQP